MQNANYSSVNNKLGRSALFTAPNSITLGDYNLGSVGATIPLPSGVSLQLKLAMTDISTNPPADISGNNHSAASNYNTPTIQTSVTRVGKTYAGYTPGTASQSSTGAFHWTYAAWNHLLNKNFAAECWINLPVISSVTGGFSQVVWASDAGNGYGSSGLGSYLAIIKIGTDVYLKLATAANTLSTAIVAITTNTWHHVAVTYDNSTQTTNLYFDGILINSNNTYATTITGSPSYFWLGHQGGGGIYANSLAGYICNFQLYT